MQAIANETRSWNTTGAVRKGHRLCGITPVMLLMKPLKEKYSKFTHESVNKKVKKVCMNLSINGVNLGSILRNNSTRSQHQCLVFFRLGRLSEGFLSQTPKCNKKTIINLSEPPAHRPLDPRIYRPIVNVSRDLKYKTPSREYAFISLATIMVTIKTTFRIHGTIDAETEGG